MFPAIAGCIIFECPADFMDGTAQLSTLDMPIRQDRGMDIALRSEPEMLAGTQGSVFDQGKNPVKSQRS